MATAQQRPAVQRIPPGTSAISGHIIDSVSKAPLPGCTLRVGLSGQFGNLVSDSDGAYALKDIAPGSYFFVVECDAHVWTCSGSDSPACREVEVVRDQKREGVDFQMVPGAIARGRAAPFDGRPLKDANVRLGRGMKGEGTPRVTPAITDAEGHFELTNLAAGEWRLQVEIPPAPGGLTPPVVD